jgi:hypothetical protein
MDIDLSARYTVASVPGMIFIPIGYDQNEDETVNPGLVWLHPEGGEPADVFPADELTPVTEPAAIRVPLTGLQAAFLDDLDVSGSESYAEAVAAGLRVEGSTLVVPPGAFEPLGTAVGIRADIADEGEYETGRRNSILGLARKLARAGVTGAAPL